MPRSPHRSQLTTARCAMARLHDAWTTDVVPRLPAGFDAQARRCGALRRTRKVGCAGDLLRGLLAYVLCGHSFRMLGAWGVVRGLADLSETAWRKRLRGANPWLLWLLTHLCHAPGAVRNTGQTPTRRVLLIDSTMLARPRGTGADWRVHTAYSFTAGHLHHVVVTDYRTAEHVAHHPLHPGDIAVADSGYGQRRNVAAARQHQADVVLRITHQNFPLERAAGSAVDLVAWVQTHPAPMLDQSVFCRDQQNRYAVRVLAIRVSAAAARRRQRRVQHNIRKKGRQPQAVTLAMCQWVFLVTTLDADAWPSEAIAYLYRARWHIELVVKQMKSLLDLDEVRVMGSVAVEAVVRLKLIAWLLQADGAATVRQCLDQVHADHPVPPTGRVLSSWRMTSFSLTTLRQQVLGQWSAAQVQACLPRLQRYLYDGPRIRRHQETRLRPWLVGGV